MEFIFTAKVALSLQHTPGDKTSRVHQTDIRLDVSKNLDRRMYILDDLPTIYGCKAISSALIAGLVANIHTMHDKGWRDSAEHLRHIIDQLEKGFIAVGNVTEGEMNG